jgi:HSP20 family protein
MTQGGSRGDAAKRAEREPFAVLAETPTPRSDRLVPAVEVRESAEDYRVLLDLPGVDESAIDLQAEEHGVTVEATKAEPALEGGTTLSYSDRVYGTYYRAVWLPEGIDRVRVRALYRDGVLEVIAPKRAAAER